jgi:hypothetical protein
MAKYPQTKRGTQYLVTSLLFITASGCAIHTSDGVVKQYSFGLTVVTLPKKAPSRPDFTVTEISSYGFSVGQKGAVLGYGRLKTASLPPNGALYFEVNSAEEFERIQNLIKQYPNKTICVSQALVSQ